MKSFFQWVWQWRKRIIGLLILVVIGVVLYLNRSWLTREQLVEYGHGLHPAALFVAFLLLPLVGAPISVFLLLAGLRYGFVWGMIATVVCILFHHCAAYWISNSGLRRRLVGWLAKSGRKVPEIAEKDQLWSTMVFAGVSGPPYAIKLYLLAITGIPFRIYIGAGAPVYMVCSLLAVAAGTAVTKFNPIWIFVISTSIALTVLLVKVLRRRLGVHKARNNA